MSGYVSIALACVLLASVTTPSVAQVDALHFDPATAPTKAGEILLDTPRSQDRPVESWLTQSSYLQVRNVQQTTLLSFLPPAHLAIGEALIVAPGGSFLGLAIENEGWVVAQALADKGIAAFALKYRVLPTPAAFKDFEAEMLAVRRASRLP